MNAPLGHGNIGTAESHSMKTKLRLSYCNKHTLPNKHAPYGLRKLDATFSNKNVQSSYDAVILSHFAKLFSKSVPSFPFYHVSEYRYPCQNESDKNGMQFWREARASSEP